MVTNTLILRFQGKAVNVWRAWDFLVKKAGNRTLGELAPREEGK